MTGISNKDIDFLHHIIEDISFLYDLGSTNKNITTDIRHASVVLRRLVLENELKRAATFINLRLELRKTYDLQKIKKYTSQNSLTAQTAHAKLRS